MIIKPIIMKKKVSGKNITEYRYVSSSDELTAVGGLLISLSEVSDLEWKWSMRDEEIRNLLDSENENINLISKFCYKAKISVDYLRKNTKN